ncbi:MAG: VanZ family protein [Blastocatellia bacterium]
MNERINLKNPKHKIQNSNLFYWLPPLTWMAAIFFFSTDSFSGENTGSLLYDIAHKLFPSLTLEQFQPIHVAIRKAAHFTEYGLLTLLLFRAFRTGNTVRWKWSWARYSWLVIVIYALSDEYHQSFVASRTASIYDSLVDISGGTTALLVLWLIRRKQ